MCIWKVRWWIKTDIWKWYFTWKSNNVNLDPPTTLNHCSTDLGGVVLELLVRGHGSLLLTLHVGERYNAVGAGSLGSKDCRVLRVLIGRLLSNELVAFRVAEFTSWKEGGHVEGWLWLGIGRWIHGVCVWECVCEFVLVCVCLSNEYVWHNRNVISRVGWTIRCS